MTDQPKPLPHGVAVAVGDITIVDLDGTKLKVRRAILVQFNSEAECKEAIERRGMTFGLFEAERAKGDEPCGR
jgi:hypothetical protein